MNKVLYGCLFNTENLNYSVRTDRHEQALIVFKLISEKYKIRTAIDIGAGRNTVLSNIHIINPDIELFIADLDNFHKLDYCKHINCDLTINEDISNLLINKYDILFCLDCLEHLPTEKLDSVIEVLAKICQVAFISVPNTEDIIDNIRLHLTVKPKAWWDESLQRHFSIVDSKTENNVLFYYTLKSNYI